MLSRKYCSPSTHDSLRARRKSFAMSEHTLLISFGEDKVYFSVDLSSIPIPSICAWPVHYFVYNLLH